MPKRLGLFVSEKGRCACFFLETKWSPGVAWAAMCSAAESEWFEFWNHDSRWSLMCERIRKLGCAKSHLEESRSHLPVMCYWMNTMLIYIHIHAMVLCYSCFDLEGSSHPLVFAAGSHCALSMILRYRRTSDKLVGLSAEGIVSFSGSQWRIRFSLIDFAWPVGLRFFQVKERLAAVGHELSRHSSSSTWFFWILSDGRIQMNNWPCKTVPHYLQHRARQPLRCKKFLRSPERVQTEVFKCLCRRWNFGRQESFMSFICCRLQFWCAQDSASPGSLPLCIADAHCKKMGSFIKSILLIFLFHVVSFHVVLERPGQYWLHAGREASAVASGLPSVTGFIDCIRTLAYYNLKSGSNVQSFPRSRCCIRCMLKNIWRICRTCRTCLLKCMADLPFVFFLKTSFLPLLNILNLGFGRQALVWARLLPELRKTFFIFFHSIILYRTLSFAMNQRFTNPQQRLVAKQRGGRRQANLLSFQYCCALKRLVTRCQNMSHLIMYIAIEYHLNIWGRSWRNSTLFCTAHHCTVCYAHESNQVSCDGSVTGCWEDGMRCQNVAKFKWQESRDAGSNWTKRQSCFSSQLTFQVP